MSGTPRIHPPAASRRRAFTLVELLVVMAVLLLLAILTVVAAGRVGRDIRLASATNTVVAALGEARAAAIRSGNLVLVTFRIAPVSDDPADGQVTEVIVAEWTRLSESPFAGNSVIADIYRPIANIPPRSLPRGIKVAGPWTDIGQETVWITQPQFAGSAALSEADRCFAIMFGADGALITRNPYGPMSATSVAFVDFDSDSFQDFGNAGAPNPRWIYDELGDECWLNPAQFLAVFDDADARQRYDTSAWGTDDDQRREDLTEYIAQFAERINFNFYTGVVVR